MADAEFVEKTLYALIYHTDREYGPATCHKLTFFYASDAMEARQKADEKRKRFLGPFHEIELKACPGGFRSQRREMQGKLLYDQDGRLT